LHIHQASGNSSIRLTSGASWPLTINQSATSICTISNVNKPVLTLAGANVGIGTTAPATLLDVETSSGGYVQVDGGYNQLSGFSIMETNAGRWILFFRGWESDNLIVRDEVGKRDSMTFQSGTGRVGIGTSAPASALEVADRITAGKVDGTFLNWTPGGASVSVKRLICGSDPHAGYGVATGPDHASPIVWMYSQPGNRFEVMGMDYGESIPHVGRRLMRVEITGDTHIDRDAYARVFVPTSDRNLKTNVTPVTVQQVLAGVLALPISTWDFTNSPGTRHLGRWRRISTPPSAWAPMTSTSLPWMLTAWRWRPFRTQ